MNDFTYKDWRIWALGFAPYVACALVFWVDDADNSAWLFASTPPWVAFLVYLAAFIAAIAGGAAMFVTFFLAPMIPFHLFSEFVAAQFSKGPEK